MVILLYITVSHLMQQNWNINHLQHRQTQFLFGLFALTHKNTWMIYAG